MNKFEEVLDTLSGGELTQDNVEDIFVAAREALYSDDEWRGEKPYSIIVGDETFNMKFKGLAQIGVLERMSAFLETDFVGVLDGFSSDGDQRLVDNLRMLAQIVDPQFFIGVGIVLLGRDADFVAENFDLEWILGGAEMAYNANRTVKRMVTAFFGRLG